MVGLVEGSAGGITALFSVLISHWGAVERDLITAGLHMSDVETERLSFEEFTSFVLYAPPGTSVYHVVNGGWTPDTHQLTSILDVQQMLWWAKTKDAQSDFPQHKPKPYPRPNAEPVDTKPVFTIGDYMQITEGG